MPDPKTAADTHRFRFSSFARKLAILTGRPATFMVAIVTFLVVFLIQNTQNRDTAAPGSA